MNTILTQPLSPEQEKALRRDAAKREQINILVFDLLLPAYAEGAMPLEKMLRSAYSVVSTQSEASRAC